MRGSVNVSVRLSSHAEASLSQGWLRIPLVEMGNLGGRVRESFDRAKAEGPLVTLAQYTGRQDAQAKLEAVVVGGARPAESRDLALGVSRDYADALTMAAIVPAINQRFTYFDGRKQIGIATPLADDYIELKLPSRYTADPHHFVNVVLRIGFNESTQQRSDRLSALTDKIQHPDSAQEACWELEALGESTIDILAGQLTHPDARVRFHCAPFVGLLGRPAPVPVLAELTRSDPPSEPWG